MDDKDTIERTKFIMMNKQPLLLTRSVSHGFMILQWTYLLRKFSWVLSIYNYRCKPNWIAKMSIWKICIHSIHYNPITQLCVNVYPGHELLTDVTKSWPLLSVLTWAS